MKVYQWGNACMLEASKSEQEALTNGVYVPLVAHSEVMKSRDERILELTRRNDALAVDLDAARRQLAERDHAAAILILAAEAETAQALKHVEELEERDWEECCQEIKDELHRRVAALEDDNVGYRVGIGAMAEELEEARRRVAELEKDHD